MKIEISKNAQAEFEALPTLIKVKMRDKFDKLKGWPNISGIKTLTGIFAGYQRVRTGDYRAIMSVRSGKIIIHRVAHRKKVYNKPL